MRRAPALVAALLLASALACARSGSPEAAPEPPRKFLQDRAWQDLERLAALGSRPAGSEGSAAAREYLRGELEQLGVEVRELSLELPAPPTQNGDTPAEPGQAMHLVAVIPGESPDLVLLGASYDGPAEDGPAADAAASAPALVLEMARAVAANPLPYTTWAAFLEGDLGGASPEHRAGSFSFARQLAMDGVLQQIRVAVFFRRVAAADLHVQRDLLSDRLYRESMWRAASRNGADAMFPPDAGFSTAAGAHLAFLQVGARRAVMLAGAGEPLPAAEDTLDRCSPESLGRVGQVGLDALDEITRTLVKVDRLAPGRGPGAGEGTQAAPAPPE